MGIPVHVAGVINFRALKLIPQPTQRHEGTDDTAHLSILDLSNRLSTTCISFKLSAYPPFLISDTSWYLSRIIKPEITQRSIYVFETERDQDTFSSLLRLSD